MPIRCCYKASHPESSSIFCSARESGKSFPKYAARGLRYGPGSFFSFVLWHECCCQFLWGWDFACCPLQLWPLDHHLVTVMRAFSRSFVSFWVKVLHTFPGTGATTQPCPKVVRVPLLRSRILCNVREQVPRGVPRKVSRIPEGLPLLGILPSPPRVCPINPLPASGSSWQQWSVIPLLPLWVLYLGPS